MAQPVVFDIETKHSFREVNNDITKLEVSVAAAYDYQSGQLLCYREESLPELFRLFEQASVIIGFNSNHFDLAVLNTYYVGDIYKIPHFDILEDVKELLGKRLPLDDLVQATLNEGKTGHGMAAITLYREGNFEALEKYCKDDVRLTKDLFQYGATHGYIYYPDIPTKKTLRVPSWQVTLNTKQSSSHNLSLGL